jgi:hypothetical protein
MPSAADLFVLGLSTLSLYYACFYLRQKGALRAAPCPPGPKGYPIIHNLLDIPTRHPWEIYAELGKKYGMIEALFNGTFY